MCPSSAIQFRNITSGAFNDMYLEQKCYLKLRIAYCDQMIIISSVYINIPFFQAPENGDF